MVRFVPNGWHLCSALAKHPDEGGEGDEGVGTHWWAGRDNAALMELA